MQKGLRPWFSVLVLAASALLHGAAHGQEPLPPVQAATPPTTTPPTATQYDLQAILARLERQEAELQQLRAALGVAQNGDAQRTIASATAPSSGLTAAAPVSYSLNGSAMEIANDFDRRIAALEQIVNQPLPGAGAKRGEPIEVGSDKKLSASWNNGLELKNASGDYRIHIGGASNFDINAFDTDPELEVPRDVGGIGPNPDSMQIRRARITIDGTFYEVFDFKTEFEFANFLVPAAPTTQAPVANSPGFTDFWLQWKKLPVVGHVRAGNQKEPLGMEHMMSYKATDFNERSYLQDMVFGPFNNGFNPGISVFNFSEDQRFTWAIGGFGNNSDPWGYSIGDDWALTGRLTYLLAYDEPSNGRYLWEVGGYGSVRKPDEDIVRLRTRGNIRSGPPGSFNPIYADTSNVFAAQQEILGFETAAQWGALSVQGEYVGTWVEDAVQPNLPVPVSRGTPYFQGAYLTMMYFLTGEHRNYNKSLAVLDRVVPNSNFFWVDSAGGSCWSPGAWQVGVRLSFVDLNDNGINGGQLNSCTFGLNWYLNPNARMQFNYDLTHRSQVRETPAGQIAAFGTRFSFDF